MALSGLTIRTERFELVTVVGLLDDSGLDVLRARLDCLLDEGCRAVAVDLTGVTRCDTHLLRLLAATGHRLEQEGGRFRLIGIGQAVLRTLDHALLPELLAVYRASTARTMIDSRELASSPSSP